MKTIGLVAALAGSWIEGAKIQVSHAYEQLAKTAGEIEESTLKGSKEIAEEVLKEGELLKSGPGPKSAPALPGSGAGAASTAAEGSAAGSAAGKALPIAGQAGSLLLGLHAEAVLKNNTTPRMCQIEQCGPNVKVDEKSPDKRR